MVDSQITLVGNIVTEPELRFTPKGTATCSFRFGQSDRVKNQQTGAWEDRKPELFIRVTVFGHEAENIVESDHKPGTRVVLTGTLRQEREWTDKDGNTRPGNIEFIADEVAVSHKFAKVSVERSSGRQSRQQQAPSAPVPPAQTSGPVNDPWGGGQQAAQPVAQQQPAADPWAPNVADPWAPQR